jgi:hypothetical protein
MTFISFFCIADWPIMLIAERAQWFQVRACCCVQHLVGALLWSPPSRASDQRVMNLVFIIS